MAAAIFPPNETPGPLVATPWRASDHHSYAGIPSRGTPEALFESCWIFSGRVRREMRDRALVVMGRETSQKGYELWCGGLHGNWGPKFCAELIGLEMKAKT